MPSKQPEPPPASGAMAKIPHVWKRPEIPEFDVWQDESGRLHGKHRSSGTEIEAPTVEQLHGLAMIERIAHSWQPGSSR